MTNKKNPLSANYRLGFLGAGQLARMSGLQAFRYGIQLGVFSDRDEHEPVESMTPHSHTGSFESAEDLITFAETCGVLTLENEFISSEILKQAQEKSNTPIYPSPATFALIENKLIEKQTFEDAGIPVTPYTLIQNDRQLTEFGNKHGWPFLLKSSKGGYDGYGNETVHDLKEALEAFGSLGGNEGHNIIAEAFVDFTHELAVQVARNETGHEVYPCCETVQQDHICVGVKSPAPVEKSIRKKAKELALKATETIDGKGIFAYEFFLKPDGELLLNESAPRPHNSGHYTIEGCVTSQFENHVRAVLGLPLGSAALRKPAVAMINLLGTDQRDAQVEDTEQALAENDGHLHIYGKLDSRVGRKMAHYTLLGNDLEETYGEAEELTEKIRI
ncbi:5-(carboxyamino)imidazole ribonucleotide synthase [Fodinibius salinus]|uniref:N5-carboxyaminoimidazole ribonucleotide synthase n=1 Tax=Fodinibius salinus TaxID=860790 RepID=A0A5D3YPX8_9BACT|nr:5-(carboxyamino)imidazole ribonucleotide synthase [Fodinibius salinus]TYP95308.1 5-(carboxyamino)imidazole ribonucleotide synthase [Fodinibius salinus]